MYNHQSAHNWNEPSDSRLQGLETDKQILDLYFLILYKYKQIYSKKNNRFNSTIISINHCAFPIKNIILENYKHTEKKQMKTLYNYNLKLPKQKQICV
jgi:hypothetical protein